MTPFDIGLCLLLLWAFVFLCVMLVSRHSRKDADGYREYINKLKENEERLRRQAQRLKEQNRKLMERINYIENDRG